MPILILTFVNYDGNYLCTGRISAAYLSIELAQPVKAGCIRVAFFLRTDAATGLCCSARMVMATSFALQAKLCQCFQICLSAVTPSCRAFGLRLRSFDGSCCCPSSRSCCASMRC